MSDHRGGVWGAREDAVWWPGAIAADQQTLHQQFMQQQQLAVQQQQQQVAQAQQHQAIQQQNDAAAAHQLFSYKMASTFQHPTTTQSSNPISDMRYDYRVAGNSGPTQSQAPQWSWYSNSMDNSLVNQSSMQNMSPVHTPPPAVTQQSQVQSSIQQQQVEAQVRQQQQHQQAVEVHRQQEVQRHQAEAQARHQAEAQVARQQVDAQVRLQNHQSHPHQNNQHTQTVLQNHQQHQRLLAADQDRQKLIQNLNTSIQVPTRGRMPRGKADARPRGRMTAYAFFVQTCREEHKKKHPEENVVFAEFSKKCAERWKTMLDKEKKRFHEMAEKDKKRYDDEMQHYVPPKGEKQRGKKRKQVKDPNAPKRSLSAFFWFCNDERGKVKAQNPEYGVGDIAKELGRRWADADPEDKSKYEALAEKDKARYEKEMTAYKKKNTPGMQQQQGSLVQGGDDEDEEDDIDDDEDD